MNPELKQQWLDALKSDKYAKGKCSLRRIDDTYCCLGVLADVIDPDKWRKDVDGKWWWGHAAGWLPLEVTKEVGLILNPDSHTECINHQVRLGTLNDETSTFKEVIEYIEKEL